MRSQMLTAGVFDGLTAPGILDWDFYDEVAGRQMFLDGDTPDTTIVAGFVTGLSQLGGWTNARFCNSGVLVGEYRFGNGCLVLNGLPLLPNLDRHPAADRLLLNLIAYGLSKRKESLARATGDVEEYFRTMSSGGPGRRAPVCGCRAGGTGGRQSQA